MSKQSKSFTAVLAELTQGDSGVVDHLLPLVYDELHLMAQRHMRGERVGHTLNATALINEAYLKLVDQNRVKWQNRAHFLGVASMAMRRILINYAEARRAQKRGGDAIIATFDDEFHQREARNDDLIELDRALDRLKQKSERQAKVIELWFFGGLTHAEIAEVLKIAVPTVRKDWRIARAWLSVQLSDHSNIINVDPPK